MIKPEEVAGQAKRKENENIRFRSYLKTMQMKKRWTGSSWSCTKKYLTDMTAVSAEIAVKCTLAPSRSRIWKRMRSG